LNNIIQGPVDRLNQELPMFIDLYMDPCNVNTYLTSKISHLLFIPSFNERSDMELKSTCIPIIFDSKVSWKNNLAYKVTPELELTVETRKKWSIMCPEKYTPDCYFKRLPEEYFTPSLFNIDLGESDLKLPTMNDILKINHLRKDLSQSNKSVPLTNIMVPHIDERTILEIFKVLVGIYSLFHEKRDIPYISNNDFFHNYTGIQDLDFILSERDFLKNLINKVGARNSDNEYGYRHIYNEIVLELLISITGTPVSGTHLTFTPNRNNN
jgi:hypothetical protein